MNGLAGWREAVSTADGLVDFTLLEPTILNERSLRAEDIVAADPATLRRAATVSGAEQIMLVTARRWIMPARSRFWRSTVRCSPAVPNR